MSRVTLLQAALGGPAVAGIAWLGLAYWPLARRLVSIILAIGAHAAAWAVLVLVYRGDEIVWRSFEPGLLGATILVAAELGLLLAALHAEVLPGGGKAAAVVGLAVSASAIAAVAYAGSLAVVALALPLPTVAAAGAALSGLGTRDARGLIGMAAADALALAGLSLVYARTGSIAIGESGGAGPALLLIAALVKSGAVPGFATWHLAATEGPGAWIDGALRGQAVALAALAALTLRTSAPMPWLAIAAAAAILVCGGVALATRGRSGSVASATGAAAGVVFLTLGLGGAVGTRGFLLLFPAFLLSSALVALLARTDAEEEAERGPRRAVPAGPWGWLSACALGVGLGSLLGLPPGGGFPGTWLGVSLAAARSEVTLGWLLVAGAAAVGLAIAMVASVPLIRAARTRVVPAVAGAIIGLGLLYLGTQPIRIGIGWWVRVETALDLPEVLPTAGAPGLPAIGGYRLLLAFAPALVLVAVVVALGRGVRDVTVELAPPGRPSSPGRGAALLSRGRALLAPIASEAKPVTELVTRARSIGVGFGIAAVLELGAVLLAGRIVLLSARAGFL